jgi:hypothetical protein
MSDAKHLRSQAEFCLQLAQQISVAKDAERLRGMAECYIKQAIALEKGGEPRSSSASKPADE